MTDNTTEVAKQTIEADAAEMVAEQVRSTDLLRIYQDAREELSSIPTSNRKGLEAALARFHAASEAMIVTPALRVEDVAAKVAFIVNEQEARNETAVLRALNSIRCDLNRMCA